VILKYLIAPLYIELIFGLLYILEKKRRKKEKGTRTGKKRN